MIRVFTPALFIVLFAVTAVWASPCQKYKFDFPGSALPGRVAFRWSVNTGFRSCGGDLSTLVGRKFVVSLNTLFDEQLITDTLSANWFMFDTRDFEETYFELRVHELGDHDAFSLMIKVEGSVFPAFQTSRDSINAMLSAGYPGNALALFKSSDRDAATNELVKEFRDLYPEFYPGEPRFFNRQYDETWKLRPAVYVTGLEAFAASLNANALTSPKAEVIVVLARSASEIGPVVSSVFPEEWSAKAQGAFGSLAVESAPGKDAAFAIVLAWNKKKNKYEVRNERALTNPSSKGYRKNFAPRGAIH